MKLSIRALTIVSSLLWGGGVLLVGLMNLASPSYVGFDLLFPNHAMYQAWEKLLPGFTWIPARVLSEGFPAPRYHWKLARLLLQTWV